MKVFLLLEFLELKCLPISQILGKKEVGKKGVLSVRSLRKFAKLEFFNCKQRKEFEINTSLSTKNDSHFGTNSLSLSLELELCDDREIFS